MEEHEFEVEVVFRQSVRYVVRAEDGDAAEALARGMWKRGAEGMAGTGPATLEAVRVREAPGDEDCGRDCEEALRFLRDRELVIENLSEDVFNPTVHDAVSAEEVARHLGWIAPEVEGLPNRPDIARAARTLERLCADHRVVCFTRPRVRRGERGEIRLYCTPQHLERLASVLEDWETEEFADAASA